MEIVTGYWVPTKHRMWEIVEDLSVFVSKRVDYLNPKPLNLSFEQQPQTLVIGLRLAEAWGLGFRV